MKHRLPEVESGRHSISEVLRVQLIQEAQAVTSRGKSRGEVSSSPVLFEEDFGHC